MPMCSQFGDIYQEDYFKKMMKDDIDIVKELPPHLRSLDIEAIGSQVQHLHITLLYLMSRPITLVS